MTDLQFKELLAAIPAIILSIGTLLTAMGTLYVTVRSAKTQKELLAGQEVIKEKTAQIHELTNGSSTRKEVENSQLAKENHELRIVARVNDVTNQEKMRMEHRLDVLAQENHDLHILVAELRNAKPPVPSQS